MMDTENQSSTEPVQSETDTAVAMAPHESEVVGDNQAHSEENQDSGHVDGKESWSQDVEAAGMPDDDGQVDDDDDGEIADDDEGGGVLDESGGGDAEDGEILEDGEIASDQEGEVGDEEQDEGKGEKSSANKSSPSKQRNSHRDDHGRRGHNKKDRHSKRRRSKEDSHKEVKQKKKRHRDYEYDKSGDDYESGWGSDGRRDKSDRKRDRSSPGHDKDADKRRRGSGDNNRHHGDRGRDRDSDRDKGRDRNRHDNQKDRHEKSDKDGKKERHSRDKDRKNYSDGYDSPPGIYDSPSDEEFDRQGRPKTMMSMVEDEYIDPTLADGDLESMPKQKTKKQQRRKEFFERQRRRERDTTGDDEQEQPAKKKPLLQTPMEERPICKFFKEGKCQKGNDCPFNHDYQPQKRLELCKYYVQSYCKRDGCVFLHEEFPCKYYHTGSTCYQGDNCKFSHDPLTEETEIALQNVLKEKDDFYLGEEDWEATKKHKKKGLLGDGPSMSDDQIQEKLHKMKSIPSIFDIQTHAPGQSPSKPPNTSMAGGMPGGPGPDMSPHMNPNMRFQGPPNQNTPPNRFPFMGPNGPGMDGPPMSMGPPIVSGPGLMGQGPPPMMSGPGILGAPGMQGPPMGPPAPMSQAAALVGAILRAAPMLQQYRGPNQQGQNTSMPNNMNVPGNPRYMSPNMDGSNMMGPGNMNNPNMMGGPGMNMDNQNMMGPGMNMDNQNMMGPGMNMDNQNMMGPGMSMGMSPSQDGMMSDNQQSMMGDNQNMNMGQGQGFSPMIQQSPVHEMVQDQQQTSQSQISNTANTRDPRKAGAVNDPRLKKSSIEADSGDVDMRAATGSRKSGGNMGDEDLRQDVDMRLDGDSTSNQGDNTPTQNWDDHGGDDDDMEIPAHLPPKQREMFMRIRQHTLKMKKEKSEQEKQQNPPVEEQGSKMDDDKWYSSDEEEENKPNINNILNTLTKPADSLKQDVSSSPIPSVPSSINVIQMINAIKSQPTPANRPQDPRKQLSQGKPPVQETTIIHSREGDCHWRLCRVLYVKNRIPSDVDLNDQKYKNDPRVQKILKLQELESGKVIDHTKPVAPVRSEPFVNPNVPKVPNLLDPKVFKAKESIIPRPELAPFVDPRAGQSTEVPTLPPPRPLDPRVKPAQADPRVQNRLTVPGVVPARPLDPRLSRQDSNSSISSISSIGSGVMPPLNRPFDPRLSRQNSRDSPPLDPRMLQRQSSSDPRITTAKIEAPPLDITSINIGKADPRLTRVIDSEISQMAFQRQQSQPSPPTVSFTEKESVSSESSNLKPKLDYRNDPRFRRKPISESNLSPETVGKRFTGQRKSSTEYSSPLGGEAGNKAEDSGYNSYNRPRPSKPAQQSQLPNITSVTKPETVPTSSTDATTHDILDSLQIMPPPPGLVEQQGPDKNLKDIFKTIDPTASPFC